MDFSSVLTPRWRLDEEDPSGLSAYCIPQYAKPLRAGAELVPVCAFWGPVMSRVRVDVVGLTGGDGPSFPIVEIGVASQYVIDGVSWVHAVGRYTPLSWGESRSILCVAGHPASLWGVVARVDPAWTGGEITAGFSLVFDRVGGVYTEFGTGVTKIV